MVVEDMLTRLIKRQFIQEMVLVSKEAEVVPETNVPEVAVTSVVVQVFKAAVVEPVSTWQWSRWSAQWQSHWTVWRQVFMLQVRRWPTPLRYCVSRHRKNCHACGKINHFQRVCKFTQ